MIVEETRMSMPNLTPAPIPAYDWLARHAWRTPEKTAVIDLYSGRRHTFAVFDERARRLASHLRDGCGVRQGERAAILAPNSTDYLEVQFACVKLGAVSLPLNWRLAVPELEFIVNDATPNVLIHDVEFAGQAKALKERCGLERLIDLNSQGADSGYERGLEAGDPGFVSESVYLHDIQTIMYTSGTTGHPKGAIITHGMTFFNTVNMGLPMLINHETVHLSILPLFHTGGLNCYANPVIHAGGTVAVLRTFDPGECLRLLGDKELAITHFFGVPANYQFMDQHPDFASTDLSGIKVAGVGGAPVPLATLETWAKRGVPLQQGFGMTETSPTVLIISSEMAIKKIGSTGLPALHTEVRLVDEQGGDVPKGQVGELWVRGPNITPGYWNRPEANETSFTDGWLHTGDAARQDEDGYYYIVDRWKDMYISGGENVYPAEVEAVIYELPQIAEAAVIGVPDERWGEVGCAVVATKPGQSIAPAEILGLCASKLARFKVPKTVRFVDALPRNATGKVLKRELREDGGGPLG
jgi:fatty-acyl-CoA synthase